MDQPLLALPIFVPIGLVALALGGLAAKALGIKPDGLLEGSAFGLALGFGALAYLILAIGLVGGLYLPVLIGLLAILALISLRELRTVVPAFLRAVRKRGAEKLSPSGGLMVFGSAILGVLGLIAALAPPSATDWDGLAYHLAVPKMYLAAHRIFYVAFTSHSNFPFLTEMLYTLGLALHGPGAAKLFHYSMFLATAAGILSLCRRHVTPASGPIAVLLFMSVPLVLWEAGIAYADISTALYVLLAAYAVLNWEETGVKGWIWMAGILSGFALGTKMLALVPVLALCLWVLWSGSRSRGWRTGLYCSIAVGLLAVLVGSPWYIKSYVYTANPVYPFLYNVFGGRNWSQEAAEAYRGSQLAFGMGRGPADFVLVPWNVTMNGRNFFDSLVIYGLLGPAFLGLLVVQVLAGNLYKALARLAIVSAIFLVAWFFLMQSSRYLISIVPLLCVVAGGAAADAIRNWVVGRFFVIAFVVLCVGLGVLTGSALILDSTRATLGLESAENFLSRNLDVYDAEAFVNTELPADARLVVFDEVRGFYLDREYMWGNPGHHELVPWRSFESGADMVEFFRSRGFTHALINWRFADLEALHQRFIVGALSSGKMVELFAANRVSVYELAER